MRDVDDRQTIETEDDVIVGPRARLVGTAVAHLMRRARDRVDRRLRDAGNPVANVSYQGQQSAHWPKYAPTRHRQRTSVGSLTQLVVVCQAWRSHMLYAA